MTVRFNQEETTSQIPGAVPVFDYEDSPAYATHMFGYISEAEQRYGIGAGWSFAIPYITVDRNSFDKYYIKLADGSTFCSDGSGRKTDDITFEVISGNNYVLTYKNGTKDYFNDEGIIKTEDRYGNSIQYFYDDDGLLEKVIDSVNRNITFKRTQQSNDNIDVDVYVDNQWMCKYLLQPYLNASNQRYELYAKTDRKNISFYYYNDSEITTSAPGTYSSGTANVMTIDEIVNVSNTYSFKYEYEKGMTITSDNYGSHGVREFMKIKNRKTIGSFSYTDEVIDEINYQYSSYSKFSHEPYEVTETIAQTGLKTIYMSDNFLGLIKNKKITDPDSGVTIDTDYSYDQYNLLQSYTQHTYSGQAETTVTESYEHDSKGNIISHTDKLGVQKKYSYDEATGVITKIEEPISSYNSNEKRYTVNTLDENGNIIQSSIAHNNEENIISSVVCTYDTHGNVLSKTTMPEYMKTEYFEYTDDHANIKKYMKDSTVIAKYTYDGFGRKISETDSLGRTTQYKYNLDDQIVEVINPDNTNTKNLYSKDVGYIYLANVYFNERGPVKRETIDDFGRIKSISTMPVQESQNQYDTNYHYEDVLDDDNYFVEAAFLMPWQETAQIQYDSIGRVTQVSDINGITQYEYDNFNRIIKKTNPDLSVKRIEYNDVERTRTTYDEENNKTIEKYDIENRLIEQTIFPKENSPITKSFVYDRTGQLTSDTDYNGNTTEYCYDVLGRKTCTVNAMGEASNTVYSNNFSSVTEFYSDNTVRQRTYYDTFGRLNVLTDEYDNENSYWYDDTGNLIAIIDKNDNLTQYTYDNRDNLINMTSGNMRKSYTYDEAGRVKSAENRKKNPQEDCDQEVYETENKIAYAYRTDGLVINETADSLDGTSAITSNTQYNTLGIPSGFTITAGSEQELKNMQYLRDEMSAVKKQSFYVVKESNKEVSLSAKLGSYRGKTHPSKIKSDLSYLDLYL